MRPRTTVLDSLTGHELERIYRRGDGAVGILIKVEDRLHVFEGALLTCPPRRNDHLAQNIEWEVGIRRLGILYDDLGQNQARDVFAGGGVDHLYILTALQHLRHLIEVHIPAVGRVIQTPVFVFFNENGFRLHISESYPLTSIEDGVVLSYAALQQILQHTVLRRNDMNSNRKFTNEAPAAEKQTEAVETMTTFYTKSVERLAEAQKKTLDVALQQNTDLIGAWKKIAQIVPGTPVLTILDLAANTFGQFVDLQKGAIDLALEQSQTLAGLSSERFDSVSKASDTLTTVVQDTVERVAATQKNAIEFSAAQTKTLFDTFKKQSGVAGTPVEAATESIQRGFDTLVETQKEILNIASKRTHADKVSA